MGHLVGMWVAANPCGAELGCVAELGTATRAGAHGMTPCTHQQHQVKPGRPKITGLLEAWACMPMGRPTTSSIFMTPVKKALKVI